MSAVAQSVRAVWLMLGITLVMLSAGEIAARFFTVVPQRPDDVLAFRALGDVYRGTDWASAYFGEFALARTTAWHSYIYWRRRPFSGRFINIDERGLRKTWISPKKNQSPTKIFVFGGSVVWGEGTRDEYTIPSSLAKALAARGFTNVEVTNFGESGHVSMQELIAFEDELRRDNAPDVAVFFDGVNDLFTAQQSRVAGIPQNEMNRVREFNIFLDDVRLYRETLSTLLHRSALFYLVTGPPPPPQWPPPWNREMETLSQTAIDIYKSTTEVTAAVAKAHGSRAFFYWQPLLFTKVHLTPHERNMSDKSPLRDFYTHAYDVARVRLADAENVRDLSGIFADDEQPRYIDFCHLGEAGNEIIGAAIASDVAPLLQAHDATVSADALDEPAR